jgi:hypothetical protein
MDAYPYDKALVDIITRPNELRKDAGHVYGYALMAICDHLGTHLLPFCDGFYYGDDWEAAKNIMAESGVTIDLERMFETARVFPIPPIADFPVINYFTKDEVALIASQMDTVEIDDSRADSENDDFDEIQECLFNMRQCFRAAREKGVELVTFMH